MKKTKFTKKTNCLYPDPSRDSQVCIGCLLQDRDYMSQFLSFIKDLQRLRSFSASTATPARRRESKNIMIIGLLFSRQCDAGGYAKIKDNAAHTSSCQYDESILCKCEARLHLLNTKSI